MTKKRLAAWAGAGAAVVLVAAQLVPVNATNPVGGTDLQAPDEVREVLRRACYDCHSNETVWPWYGQVAPVSWLVARDIALGREAVNYSLWSRYPAGERRELLEETWEEVAEGEMPPAAYRALHPQARLDPADRAVLRAWAGAPRRGE